MPRTGYTSVTLKDETVALLDGLVAEARRVQGTDKISRADVLSGLVAGAGKSVARRVAHVGRKTAFLAKHGANGTGRRKTVTGGKA